MHSTGLYIGEGGGRSGGGGMRFARSGGLLPGTKWAPRRLILIGDKPPHGVMDGLKFCTKMRDYREEVKGPQEKADQDLSHFM